ncbi:MATE family efflux transporter [Vibrio sp. ZSDZ34]|uniref:Multidrug resistance protein NorM n=1 Tax=Vibrio gelatinilyticus TaxID=2893468 RepID=A0A9X2AW16_9VIBR|nr:MATE family efflux transporter [Vibrio gelatinilyticus]MCJ2376930.1 MATE family efflux transporter [Vibrio gelatinilyticus]
MEEQRFSAFLKRILLLGTPIALQSLLFSSLGFVDSLMISQLGNDQVAAAGIGSRVFWVASVFIWGMGSGMGILLAQYWGAKDSQGLKRNLALGTSVTQLFATFCFIVCFFFPALLPSWFDPSEPVQALSESYVRLLGIAILFAGVSISIDSALRSIGKTRINLYLSILEIGVNVILNYLLIFGHFGLPALGLIGAGIGSVIARTLRLVTAIIILYRGFPELAIRPQHFANAFNRVMLSKFLTVTYPIIVGSFIWCAGIFTFHIILGRMGDVELATMAVITPIESIALSIAHGISSAAAIMIGNALGANEFSKSEMYARWALRVSVIGGMILAGMLLVLQPLILTLYGELSEQVQALMVAAFPIMALSILFRTINITLIVGILRSGGDSKFCMNMDFVCQWLWAVPMTALGAMYFEWTFPIVLLMMVSEEMIKLLPAAWRVFGNRWVNNLTEEETS